VVLYGFETWSPTLREEHRLTVFENRVLRRIFGLERDEVRGGWRELLNEELHNLLHAYRLLVGKPEGKRFLGRPRHRWVDAIVMDLRDIG
jgi:PAS domain-containing protein